MIDITEEDARWLSGYARLPLFLHVHPGPLLAWRDWTPLSDEQVYRDKWL